MDLSQTAEAGKAVALERLPAFERDRDKGVRRALAFALRRTAGGEAEARAVLERLAKDKVAAVRSAASD